MSLVYSEDQLVREVQLLLALVAYRCDMIVGEGAGARALGLDPDRLQGDRHFMETRHPDDLVALERFDVWHEIRRVERYVKQQIRCDRIRTDLTLLCATLRSTFSPEVIEEFREEREAHPEDHIPGRWEEGAGDVALGHFHRGILQDLLDLASARFKVDEGEPLALAEIALLLNMREATVVTNAHRKKFATYEEENRRYSLPEAALPWMTKNGYRPTMSSEATTENSRADGASPTADEDFVFVPATRDNTLFSPECRIRGRYTIGAHGEERRFTDFFAALRELNRMATPRWRARMSNGISGIAWGVRFERVPREDLERALAQLIDSN